MVELIRKLRAYRAALARTKITVPPDLVGLLRRRPSLLVGVGAFELALLVSGSVDARLKTLAALTASAQVGCPF